MQALGAAFTAAVVVGTLWLFGALGWAAGAGRTRAPWLKSPIGLGVLSARPDSMVAFRSHRRRHTTLTTLETHR